MSKAKATSPASTPIANFINGIIEPGKTPPAGRELLDGEKLVFEK